MVARTRWDVPVTFHEDELGIDEPLVRALVDRYFPRFAGLPLRRMRASGSSNALFRLGVDFLVRLPRQPGGSQTIAKEARWVPHMAPELTVSIPEIVGVGEPDLGYPESWSIVHWIDGKTPAAPSHTGGTTDRLARDLAGVVRALGEVTVPTTAMTDTSLSWYRGGPLAAMDEIIRHYLGQCRTLHGLHLDLDACLQVWEEAMTMPGASEVTTPRWLHGDLLAENLLVHEDRLVAVLDFGGLAVGDPTVDLMVGWELLDPAGREKFRSALQVEESTWLRGRAWALAIAIMTFPYYWSSMPERCASRLVMARSVLADTGLLAE